MHNLKGVDELVVKARKYILDQGYSPTYRYSYHWIWKKFSQYTNEIRQMVYSTELGMKFYCSWLGYTTEAETEKKNEYKFRAMKVLDDIFHDRPLKRKYSHKTVYIPACFLSVYNAYLKHLADKEQKPRTIETKSSRLLIFLRFLEKEDIVLPTLSFQEIEEFFRHISTDYNRTAQANIKYTLRDFLEFSSTIGFTPNDSDKLIGIIYGNKHERLPSTYTIDELKNVLSSIDRDTSYGKRDFVLIMLLIQLGVRSSDICNLSLGSINLEDHTINFIQEKTGVAEKLPLTEAVELAIADYIVNVRQKAPSDRLFAVHHGVHKGRDYSAGMPYAVLNKYMKKANIKIEGKRHGPHSIRHSLSSNLLKCGTPLTVISTILGHSSSEVTNRYIWMDTEQLRRLSLEVRNEN